MPLVVNVTTGTYDFVFLIVKIILLALSLLVVLPLPAAGKTQCFVCLSFNYNMQLTNGISRDLQKLIKYFNGTAVAAFLELH